MAVDVFDDDGKPCAARRASWSAPAPFPSMPVGFWNDPDGAKYHAAYFERFANVWCHGDFAEWTAHGGIDHPWPLRRDAQSGRRAHRHGRDLRARSSRSRRSLEALAIGQDWDNDVRVVLFVRLRDGRRARRRRCETRIKAQDPQRRQRRATCRRKIVAVADIPRTKSGKITELAVRDVVHGRAVKNKEALANPEALDYYRSLSEL